MYSLYNYKVLNTRLEELQDKHYTAIAEIDKLLLATSQTERAISLYRSEQVELAETIRQRSQNVLNRWTQAPVPSDPTKPEKDLSLLVLNLENFTTAVFDPEIAVSSHPLAKLLEQIEETAINAIVVRHDIISNINHKIRIRARIHFYVVLSGIIASVMLMALVAYLLSQRILAPIDALTEAASRLGDDDWDTNYTPSRKDEIGKLETTFIETAKQIREYKRITNKKIVQTRLRMQICFNNLPYPIFFINAQRTIFYKNPTAADIIDKLEWNKALPPSLLPRVDSVFGTGEEMLPTNFEETVTFKVNNVEQHFLPIIVRIDSGNTNDIECALVLQEVTKLRLSDDLKSDLVATISHEIKTPVTSATMALHLLLEKSLGELNEDQEDMIQTAADDLKRLRRLLDHMLQIARLEKNSPQLNREIIQPSFIVQEALESHAHLARNKNLTLTAEVESSLPEVLVDPKLIGIALANFVSNALKYSNVDTNVSIYTSLNDNQHVVFGVRDQGPGIPNEDTEKVFEKFYRSSRTSMSDGIGFGLSISKDIVIAHEGTIGCANLSEGGTDFHFTLPVHPQFTS